jgi:hypothetical protein
MKVFEVTKKPVSTNRNPVAAYAQRSGAGVHKDQNKKNKPQRKEKHKKKDFTTESQLNENPIVGVGINALKWLFRWMIKNPKKTVIIWGGIKFGPDVYKLIQIARTTIIPLAKYGIPALAIAYVLINGVKLWNMLKDKDPETISVDELKKLLREPVEEAYTQKAGDYESRKG